MPGPAPKLKTSRVRRNVPRNGEWIELLTDPFTGVKPSLAGLPTDGPLTAFAKHAWEAWWASPMAHQWDESDHRAVLRLLLLTDQFAKASRRGSVRDMPLAEIRQLEDRLGLNEAGRIKLRWLLPTDDQDIQTSAPSRRKRVSSSSKMRDRLKVVDGGAA